MKDKKLENKLFWLFLVAYTTFIVIMTARGIIRKAEYGFTWWFEDISSCDIMYYIFTLPPLTITLWKRKSFDLDLDKTINKGFLCNHYFVCNVWNFLSMICIAPFAIYNGFDSYNLIGIFLYVTGIQNLCNLPILAYGRNARNKTANNMVVIIIAIMPYIFNQLLQLIPISKELLLFVFSSLGILTIFFSNIIIDMLIRLCKNNLEKKC